jgi:uncharacterized membrane protein YfcA
MELFGIDGLGWLIRLILGLFIGFCIGLTSIGGGVLVLPALTVLLKIDPLVAVGTTTLYAFLTKITALFHHLHLKTINWSISRPFLMGAIPATCISAGWISLKGADELFKAQLEKFIIGIIFLGIALIIWNMCTHKKESEHTSVIARYLQAHKAVHTLSALLFGALCGGLVGATAIGGGVLVVPILMIVFGLRASQTVGTALFLAFVMTLITSLFYGVRGEQDIPTALIMSVSSTIGVWIGSRMSVKLPELLLRSIVLGLVILGAIMMCVKHGNS